MTIDQTWRDLLDDRQRKELAFAELYARDFAHGTTGHNQLLLLARLAELLDVAAGNKELPPPPAPADIRITFGKHNGRTLGELRDLDPSYLDWLSREARDEALRSAAHAIVFMAATEPEPLPDGTDLPF